MTFKERVKQNLAELEKKFDARDRLFDLLQGYYNQFHCVPSKYLKDWNIYQQDKRKWRDIPGLKRKLKKIAKLNARNQMKSQARLAKMAKIFSEKQIKKHG